MDPRPLSKFFFGRPPEKNDGPAKKMVLVLISTSVERFSVSRMRDFFKMFSFLSNTLKVAKLLNPGIMRAVSELKHGQKDESMMSGLATRNRSTNWTDVECIQTVFNIIL